MSSASRAAVPFALPERSRKPRHRGVTSMIDFGPDTFGWTGVSKSPYKDWTWHASKHRFGGPNFIELPSGELWGVSRKYPGGAKTALVKMTRDGGYDPILDFPSGGDTSYAGLVWHEGVLWISYYSSHEGKSSIYLAKVRLP